MDYSVKEWDGWYQENDVLVPYLDTCVFASKRLKILPPGATLYEFGCGLGNNLKFLKSAFPATRILGSDISQVAIDRLTAEGIANSRFWVNGDELSMPERVDLVIERGALQHVSKQRARAYSDELFEAMNPGSEAFFEIASTEHSAARTGADDATFGLRTFYSLADIHALFSRFTIQRVWHLKREVIARDGSPGDAQGSWQVELSR